MNSGPNQASTSADTIPERAVTVSAGSRLRTAMLLAVAADVLQLAVIPLFVEGAESPVADVVDVVMAAVLYLLLGWHWEFAPSFLGKLVPGVDLVPLWSLAVANVYRKSRRSVVVGEHAGPVA